MRDQFNSWQSLFFASFKNFLDTLMSSLPLIIGAILLLIVGWIVAKILSYVVSKLLKTIKFDTLTEKQPFSEYLSKANIKAKPSDIIRKLVYWVIFLLFAVTASDTMGWDVVSEEISSNM